MENLFLAITQDQVIFSELFQGTPHLPMPFILCAIKCWPYGLLCLGVRRSLYRWESSVIRCLYPDFYSSVYFTCDHYSLIHPLITHGWEKDLLKNCYLFSSILSILSLLQNVSQSETVLWFLLICLHTSNGQNWLPVTILSSQQCVICLMSSPSPGSQ